MKRIPLYVYIGRNNPKGAVEVIRHFGLRKPTSHEDVIRGLRHVQSTFGREGLLQMSKVHPDRQLILVGNESEVKETSETKSGSDGSCSCKENKSNTCGDVHSNANGESEMIAIPSNSNDEVLKAIQELKESGTSTTEETPQLTKEDVSNEVKNALRKNNTFIKDTLPYIALGSFGLILFMASYK